MDSLVARGTESDHMVEVIVPAVRETTNVVRLKIRLTILDEKWGLRPAAFRELPRNACTAYTGAYTKIRDLVTGLAGVTTQAWPRRTTRRLTGRLGKAPKGSKTRPLFRLRL